MTWHLSDPQLLQCCPFVDGQWITSDRTFPVVNPATTTEIAQVGDGTPALVEGAVSAASHALHGWASRSAYERADTLRRWSQLICAHQEDLAMILCMEQGKPLAEARGEITYGASFVSWYAEEGLRAYGDVLPGHRSDMRLFVLKQPIGVVAAITPWNFPNAMITRKIAPALAAGCTVVVKPAEETPLSALALAELARRAGFPDGVLNVIPCEHPVAVSEAIMAHPTVRKVSFTGSTEVGKLLVRQSAPTLKKMSLELGGNAPFIVMDDADVARAVAGAIMAKFRNAGQTCVCANRIFVHRNVHDAFVQGYEAALAALTVGHGMDAGVSIGPLINQQALQKVKRLVSAAEAAGATIVVGGESHPLGGTFYAPTLLTGVEPTMEICREEIFGPVAAVIPFSSDQEVVEKANFTRAGLAAYLYGKDLSRVWQLAEALEYGMVGINTGMLSTAAAPFGGIKESGFGREGSKYGLDEYLTLKYIAMEV